MHEKALAQGADQLKLVIRELALKDLFYLMTRVLKRRDIDKDWLFERCMEVQASPDGHLDLWAREHYKSTIITFGKTIQDILNNPEITVGIFSHTKPIAKAFLAQIKEEFEKNLTLISLFPEVLWKNKKEAKQKAYTWSMEKGITVKRTGNAKEGTIEAHGLVDGQPTSKHYSLLVYDDVVTLESVSTPEQIEKVTNAYRLSLNLGARGGTKRLIGTRYHRFDTYESIIKAKTVIPRIYTSTHNGKPDGKPVLLSQKENDDKRNELGPYIYACQMLQDPKADADQQFELAWLRFWTPSIDAARMMNLYIIVDPAGSAKKKNNDYTVMWVVGLNADGKYYVFHLVRDKMNLGERTTRLIKLHKMYRPEEVFYEQVGLQADVEHIEYVQEQKLYSFTITPMSSPVPKNTRIRSLVPIFSQNRIFLPHSIIYTDYEGHTRDLIDVFKTDEYEVFPFVSHDDMLDDLAWITDSKLDFSFPMPDVSGVARLGAGYGQY